MQEIVYHTNFELEDTYWWFIARNYIVLNLFTRLCQIENDDHIIDFGCGTGGFTKLLSEKFNVIGIDNSPLALEYCRKRGLNDVMLSSLDNFPEDNYKIKAITMLDVIEHIADDNDIVHKAYNLLPSGGYLIVTVPAYKWLWSHHDVLHMHHRRYNIDRIKKVLTSQGFEIIYSTYFNTFLFILSVLKRYFDKSLLRISELIGKRKKNYKSKSYMGVDKVSPFINKIFAKTFKFERHFLPKFKFPFGLSIFLIGKK